MCSDDFILFNTVISFDREDVLVPEFHFHAGHFHHVAGGLHDVVDLTPNVLAILGGLVGLEAQCVPSLDLEHLPGPVCYCGASKAGTYDVNYMEN